jgi:hypothetical protein
MKFFRKLNSFLLKKRFTNPICEIDRTLANELIYELLNSEKPCMISRFGTTELITINNYWTRPLQQDTPKTASKIDEATYW